MVALWVCFCFWFLVADNATQAKEAHSHQPQRSEAIFTFCTQSLFAPIIMHIVQCSAGLFTHTHTHICGCLHVVYLQLCENLHTYTKNIQTRKARIYRQTHMTTAGKILCFCETSKLYVYCRIDGLDRFGL